MTDAAGARRKLDAIFGSELPAISADERDPLSEHDADRDRWLRENVPPHHG